MGLLGDSHSEKELIQTVKLQAETIERQPEKNTIRTQYEASFFS